MGCRSSVNAVVPDKSVVANKDVHQLSNNTSDAAKAGAGAVDSDAKDLDNFPRAADSDLVWSLSAKEEAADSDIIHCAALEAAGERYLLSLLRGWYRAAQALKRLKPPPRPRAPGCFVLDAGDADDLLPLPQRRSAIAPENGQSWVCSTMNSKRLGTLGAWGHAAEDATSSSNCASSKLPDVIEAPPEAHACYPSPIASASTSSPAVWEAEAKWAASPKARDRPSAETTAGTSFTDDSTTALHFWASPCTLPGAIVTPSGPGFMENTVESEMPLFANAVLTLSAGKLRSTADSSAILNGLRAQTVGTAEVSTASESLRWAAMPTANDKPKEFGLGLKLPCTAETPVTLKAMDCTNAHSAQAFHHEEPHIDAKVLPPTSTHGQAQVTADVRADAKLLPPLPDSWQSPEVANAPAALEPTPPVSLSIAQLTIKDVPQLMMPRHFQKLSIDPTPDSPSKYSLFDDDIEDAGDDDDDIDVFTIPVRSAAPSQGDAAAGHPSDLARAHFETKQPHAEAIPFGDATLPHRFAPDPLAVHTLTKGAPIPLPDRDSSPEASAPLARIELSPKHAQTCDLPSKHLTRPSYKQTSSPALKSPLVSKISSPSSPVSSFLIAPLNSDLAAASGVQLHPAGTTSSCVQEMSNSPVCDRAGCEQPAARGSDAGVSLLPAVASLATARVVHWAPQLEEVLITTYRSWSSEESQHEFDTKAFEGVWRSKRSLRHTIHANLLHWSGGDVTELIFTSSGSFSTGFCSAILVDGGTKIMWSDGDLWARSSLAGLAGSTRWACKKVAQAADLHEPNLSTLPTPKSFSLQPLAESYQRLTAADGSS